MRYRVACSLDGFIAGPDDGFDWILPAPAVRRRLTLVRHRAFPSGMLLIEYEVRSEAWS